MTVTDFAAALAALGFLPAEHIGITVKETPMDADTYTDANGVECCDQCDQELGYCTCACSDCGDNIHECACEEE